MGHRPRIVRVIFKIRVTKRPQTTAVPTFRIAPLIARVIKSSDILVPFVDDELSLRQHADTAGQP
jgi:hypothetical protein